MYSIKIEEFMKRNLISICCFLVSLYCFASPEHRLSIGRGLLSYEYLDEFSYEHSDRDWCQPSPYLNDTYETTEEHLTSFPVNLNIHYECTLGKHFGIGVCLGYDHLRMSQGIEEYKSTDGIDYNGNTRKEWALYRHDFGELDRYILFVMPEATFYWFKKNHFAMYSKLAGGIRFNFEKREFYSHYFEDAEGKYHHAYFQGSPVCFEIGNHYWRGFAEFGFGGQGIAQFGVKHTFKKKEKEK